MNASSEDVKNMLVAESALGLEYGTDLFIGSEPTSPKNCVTIYDTAGFPPYLGLSTTGYEYPSIQIIVRNNDYMTGWSLANDIKDLLHGQANETWNSTLYTLIACVSGPAHLDYDNNDNARFFINFNLQRRAV